MPVTADAAFGRAPSPSFPRTARGARMSCGKVIYKLIGNGFFSFVFYAEGEFSEPFLLVGSVTRIQWSILFPGCLKQSCRPSARRGWSWLPTHTMFSSFHLDRWTNYNIQYRYTHSKTLHDYVSMLFICTFIHVRRLLLLFRHHIWCQVTRFQKAVGWHRSCTQPPRCRTGALPHFDVTGMMVSKYDDNWEELFSG